MHLGCGARNGLDVGAGVIDEDYRGNVGVILFNRAGTPFEVAERPTPWSVAEWAVARRFHIPRAIVLVLLLG